MIRIATPTGYTLVAHQEHARLAGRFAEHWGNAFFPPPAPPPPPPPGGGGGGTPPFRAGGPELNQPLKS